MLYSVHPMPIIYTREFLKNLPQLRKEEKLQRDIDRAYTEMCGAVEYAAANGQTQYLYMIPVYDPAYELPSYTDEQLVTAFREKFAGCDVLYQEFWVEEPATAAVSTATRRTSQVATKPLTASSGNEMRLKKAILIDWS